MWELCSWVLHKKETKTLRAKKSCGVLSSAIPNKTDKLRFFGVVRQFNTARYHKDPYGLQTDNKKEECSLQYRNGFKKKSRESYTKS